MPKKGNVTRSVRIEKEVDESLRRLAEQEGVTVNTLAGRALRRFVEWDAFGGKFGFISLPGEVLNRMMDYISEEEAKTLGTWVGQNLLREFVLFWFKEINLSTVLEAYPRLLSKYGRAFTYEEHSEDGRTVIILKHQGGAKWSTFYREVVESAFRGLLGRTVSVDASENQVVMRFMGA